MRHIFAALICVQLAVITAFSQSTEPTTPYLGTLDATAVTATGAELQGMILPRGLSTTAWFEWGTTSSLGSPTDVQTIGGGTTAISFSRSLSGLQAHTTYYFRVAASNSAGTTRGDVHSFTTLSTTSTTSTSSGPSLATSDAAAVTSTAAVLNGSVTPGGSATTAWFEWGTSTPLPNLSDAQAVGDGMNSVTFRQSLSGLQPHTTYYFRAAARYAGGAVVYGSALRFTTSSATSTSTAPSVATNEAASVTSSAAVLNGIINPTGSAGTAWFEWGSTTALFTQTDAQTITVATIATTYQQPLSGLQPRTTYYFRAVARNAAGTTVHGDVRSFTTAGTTRSPGGPSVGTNDAAAVTSNSAELHGVVNPLGAAANVWFEWGNTTPLPNQTASQSAGSGTSASAFAQAISNLQPNTAYYFRAVAQAGTAIVRGNVLSFTTARVATGVPQTIPSVESGDVKSGYAIITPDVGSSAPSVIATFGMVSGGSVQSQAGVVPAALTTDASMFVEVIPSISRNIGVALVNPGASIDAITLTLRAEDGTIVGSPSIVTVSARQQVAQFVNELFGSEAIGEGFRGSLHMQSTTPFAAIGFRFSGNVFSTLPVTTNTTVPGTGSLILPQFAIAGGWATQIALVNTTTAAISGRVDIFDASGNPMPVQLNGETHSTFTFSIPIGGTFVLAPRDSNGQSPL